MSRKLSEKETQKICKKAGQDIYMALEQLPELMETARRLGIVEE